MIEKKPQGGGEEKGKDTRREKFEPAERGCMMDTGMEETKPEEGEGVEGR